LLIRREGVVKILPFIFLAIHATFEDEKGDYSEDEDEECEGDNDCLDDDFCLCVHVGC
jgi:hypothetical protein